MDKHCVEAQCSSVPTRLPRDCWVCGKTIGSDDYRLDEFGFPVHAECYAKLIEEKLAPPAPKP